jgi:hypothetical protein
MEESVNAGIAESRERLRVAYGLCYTEVQWQRLCVIQFFWYGRQVFRFGMPAPARGYEGYRN